MAWFVAKVKGYTFEMAEQVIAYNEVYNDLPDFSDKEPEQAPLIEKPMFFEALEFPPTPEAKPYYDYLLRTRKLSPEAVFEYGLGFCGDGPYAMRVVIPVLSGGQMVSWVARDITGKQIPKVLTPPGNEQSQYLLNYDRVSGSRNVVLVEGPFDCLRHPDNTVASFGEVLSSAQEGLLYLGKFATVTVAYDSEAWADSVDTAARLSEIMTVRVAKLPEGKDPDDLNDAEFKDACYQARPYSFAMRFEK